MMGQQPGAQDQLFYSFNGCSWGRSEVRFGSTAAWNAGYLCYRFPPTAVTGDWNRNFQIETAPR